MRKFVIFIGDVALLYGALALTLLLRYGIADYRAAFASHIGPFSIIFIVWLLTLYLFNLYQYKRFRPTVLLQTVALAGLVAGSFSMALFYFFPGPFGLTPKTNLILFSVIFIVLKYAWQRLALVRIFSQTALKLLVIGDSPAVSRTVAFVSAHPHLGYVVAHWLRKPTRRSPERMHETIKEQDIHLVVVRDVLIGSLQFVQTLYRLLPQNVNIMPFSAFYEDVFESVCPDELTEAWFIANVTIHRPFYDRVKRFIDVVFVCISSVVFSPFFILATLSIRLTSRGPVIFSQERVGKDGALFTLYKFRTMRHGAGGPLFTEARDRRLTAVGKFLRATHLDELPQLWNMLRGDISLIGPRPEAKELVAQYRELPYYDMRHLVKPGLTGWAQVNFKPSTTLEEAKEKLGYDIYYIKNRSFFLDLAITIRTIRYLFTNDRGTP